MIASSRICFSFCATASSEYGLSTISTSACPRSTVSSSGPSMSTCIGSSSSGPIGLPSCLPHPSLMAPFPRITILHPDSRSIRFCALPRGPMMAPKKLYPGYLSTGTISFRQHRCGTFGLSDSSSSARSLISCCRLRASRELTCAPDRSKMGSGDGDRPPGGMSLTPQSGSRSSRSIWSTFSLSFGRLACCSLDMCCSVASGSPSCTAS
mmetsp:Transcript_34714/g.103006  ORF Transcript_34714/g.103006 Transcript_34714/m.103006 type:complete len:209 (-) Transcript_34714:232-858(-)